VLWNAPTTKQSGGSETRDIALYLPVAIQAPFTPQ